MNVASKTWAFGVFFTIVLGMTGGVLAQQPDLVFHNLTEKDGLSYNLVNCFLRDKSGFLWVGTYSGLNRFDGRHFKVFKNDGTDNSLAHNTIHDLCLDPAGNIWGGTEAGIFCYDPKTNRFKNYRTSKSGNRILTQNILCDREGNIWASAGPGFMKYDSTADVFADFDSPEPEFRIPANKFFKHSMVEDASGEGIWIGSPAGPIYFDKRRGRFLNARNQPGSPIFTTHIISPICPTKTPGRVWAYDNESFEILQFDLATGSILRRIFMGAVLPKGEGATLFEDRDGNLWFGTWHQGTVLIRFRADGSADIRRLDPDPANSDAPAASFFWDVHQDADGSVWLGTTSGISVCNPERAFYKIHRLSEQLPMLKADYSILDLAENPYDGTWLIATGDQKLIQYQPETGKTRLFDTQKALPNAQGLKPANIISIRFWQGMVWLNTYFGAWIWSPKTGDFKPFNSLPAPYRDFRIHDFCIAPDSICWLVDDSQLLRWDWRAGTAQAFSFERHNSFPDGAKISLMDLHCTPNGELWMMPVVGKILGHFNPSTQILRTVEPDVQRQAGQDFGNFADINMDESGKVWIANSGQGILCYDPTTGHSLARRESDGLVFDHVSKVQPDRRTGLIWCMAYRGVSVYNPAQDRFFNFQMPDYFRVASYNNNTMQLINGHIVGNVDGDLVEFFPEKISAQNAPGMPLLSSLKIFADEKLLTNETEICLAPHENFITFRFGVPSDARFFPCELFYRLDGLNTDWVAAGNSEEAVYTDLAPGTYTFRLKARARNGGQIGPERTLSVVILSPFYKSVWFWALILMMVLGCVFWLMRNRDIQQRRLRDLESRAQALEKEKALVLYENLKQHLNPHFLFNSLTSLSSLIRISPPMANDFLDKMSKVYRYILKSREQETVSLSQELNFVKLYIGLQKTRFEEGLIVHLNIPDEYYFHKIAPVTLQNLVENAIKHNIADVESPLVIDLFVDDGDLVVRNTLRRRTMVETSNKQGLNNMRALYGYLSERPLRVLDNGKFFEVRVPLL